MRTTSDDLAQKITDQFINENPSIVIIIRRTKTATPGGGHVWSNPTPQISQVMRKVPQGRSMGERSVVTSSNGKEVVPTWLLMGYFDANIQRFDLFTIDGTDYEVLSVGRKPLMQRTVAEIVEYA